MTYEEKLRQTVRNIIRNIEMIEATPAEKEDFVPNFVNPFRESPDFAPADTKTPADKDTE